MQKETTNEHQVDGRDTAVAADEERVVHSFENSSLYSTLYLARNIRNSAKSGEQIELLQTISEPENCRIKVRPALHICASRRSAARALSLSSGPRSALTFPFLSTMRASCCLRLTTIAVAVLLSLALSGCSLMRINVGGDPMPARDLSLRVQTREFAATFSALVCTTADAIAARSKDPALRANTIRWKLSATAAVQQSSLRADPILALIDTWTLSRQMKDFIAGTEGEKIFGPEREAASQAAATLDESITAVASALLSPSDFERGAAFVDDFSSKHPMKSLVFERDSMSLLWLQHQKDEAPTSMGSMSEAITDLSDRVTAFNQQLPTEIRWRLDLERMDFEPMAAEVKRLSAGADVVFQTFPMLAENAKMLAENAKLMTKAATELTISITPEIAKFDQQWKSTLATVKTEREAVTEVLRTERIAVTAALEKQRESLMRDFTRERGEITAAADQMVQNAIEKTGHQVQGVVRSALLYGSLLALVILGLPFLSGYLVGRAARRNTSQPPSSQVK